MLGVSRLSCAFVRAGVAARGAFRIVRLLVCCVEFLPPAFKQSQPVLRDTEISGVGNWRGKGTIAELTRCTSGFTCAFANYRLHPIKQTAPDTDCFRECHLQGYHMVFPALSFPFLEVEVGERVAPTECC